MYMPEAEIEVDTPLPNVAGRPDLRVVAARRTPRRAIPRSWLATVGLLGVAVLVMYVHTVVQEANLNRMKKEIDELRELTVHDRMVLERSRNPQVIDRKAQGLGMKMPQEVVYLNKPLNVKPSAPNAIPLPQTVTHEGF